MQAAPRLADDGGRRGHRGVAAFDRLRAVDPAPHRLVLDPGFDEAFAEGNESVARVERLGGYLGVEDDVVPATLACLPQGRVQQPARSEERRVGEEWAGRFRFWGGR